VVLSERQTVKLLHRNNVYKQSYTNFSKGFR